MNLDLEKALKNKWFVEKKERNQSLDELTHGRAKLLICESLHRGVTTHNLNECFQVLSLLPKQTTLDPYSLFRLAMILIESNETDRVNKNVIFHLESQLSQLEVSKPDLFVEFLAYFIRHNRINDARELFVQRYRHMVRKFHRHVPFVDENIRCYDLYLNYLEWEKKMEKQHKKIKFDMSMQGWLVNAIECLRSTTSNYEYFVMCLVRVLLFYGYCKKAYLFSSEFQRNNPNNISAQLLHWNLLDKLDYQSPVKKKRALQGEEDFEGNSDIDEHDRNRISDLEHINNFSPNLEEEIFEAGRYPLKKERAEMVKNIRRLDPARIELIDIKVHNGKLDAFRGLMDGMENLKEVRNIARWIALRSLLDSITIDSSEVTIEEARHIWMSRYERYWRDVDFVKLVGDDVDDDEKELIEDAIATLKRLGSDKNFTLA